MDKAMIWGAGREGRGFFADLFCGAGWNVLLVEKNALLCRQLEERNQYTLWHCSSHGGSRPGTVKGFEAVNPAEEKGFRRIAAELAETRVLALCVYPGQYANAVKMLDRVIEESVRTDGGRGCEKDLLLGVNGTGADKAFLELAEKEMAPENWKWFCKNIGVVPCIVKRTCTTPKKEYRDRDPLGLMTNSYPELIVDKTRMRTDLGAIKGISVIDDLQREMTIKLYTYNLLHAVYAYGGARKGYETLWEAHMDPELHARAEAAAELSCRAVSMEYKITEKDMEEYKKKMWSYAVCRELDDRIERLAADPIRKLSCGDRIMGPILLCQKHGLNPMPIYETLADALCYLDAECRKKEAV